MLYRDLCGERVSALGFGLMRLPVADEKIDREEAARQINHAVEQGVNYLDTAKPYHGGESEQFLGELLTAGLRDKVLIATKLPPWDVETADDMERILDGQLEALQTDHIDFYLLHSLLGPFWAKLTGLNVLDFLQRARSDGRIRHAGFSFHDDLDAFKTIVDAWDWEFCQIQYNYMDEKVQAGAEGLQYAAARGIDVVIMEPLRGSVLAMPFPDDIEAERVRLGVEWSAAQLGIRWVLDHPEVKVVLSGMNEMAHVEENLAVAAATEPGGMTQDEHAIVAAARDRLREKIAVPCTACGYCMPCPNGVNIPRVFQLYNEATMYVPMLPRNLYQRMTPPDEWASNCVECGKCEEHCPQGISIIEKLAEAHEFLTATE